MRSEKKGKKQNIEENRGQSQKKEKVKERQRTTPQ